MESGNGKNDVTEDNYDRCCVEQLRSGMDRTFGQIPVVTSSLGAHTGLASCHIL